jgi:DNA topoisomerase-3
MSVKDSLALAKAEISEVFAARTEVSPQEDRDTGFFGDIVGICPMCGKELKRMKTFYGCTGYRDGCKFSVNTSICKRPIPISQLKLLTETGKTDLLTGFVSAKTGKTFDAMLKLSDGKAVFDFPTRKQQSIPTIGELPMGIGDEPPLPEPPPGY